MSIDSEELVYHVSPSRLEGQVAVSGAKNSALKLLTASVLTDGTMTIDNYPDGILDAKIHVRMLEALGKTCVVSDGKIVISESRRLSASLQWDERSIRNTLLLLGTLVTRFGEGRVPLPGGCTLGDRKYDLHIAVLKKMGADIWEENGCLCATASAGLQGADIDLAIRSTGATENAILCGCLAKGVTRIWNPHIRPEIMDLIGCLISMGAVIRVFGQEHIEVTGVDGLAGVHYTTIPDNMEAVTWLIAAVITGGDIEITNFPYEHLEVPLAFLKESGARFFRSKDALIVRGGTPYPVDISTGPYPGINSDMQPLFAVYGACARGESRIVDLRFPGRYGYAAELKKMGLSYAVADNLLIIRGGRLLRGATVRALDLRAGMALILAGLTADGRTCIQDAWQIERGYHRLVEKTTGLGGVLQARH